MESKQIQTLFFGILFLILFCAVAWLLSPFFTVILWSVLLYILFSPVFHSFTKKLDLNFRGNRILRRLLAGVFSVGTVVIFVIPLAFVTIQLVRQVSSLLSSIIAYAEGHPEFINRLIARIGKFVHDISNGMIEFDANSIRNQTMQMLMGSVQTFVRAGMQTVLGFAGFAVGLAFMVFTLYFFYIDGDYLLSLFVRAVPIRSEYTKALVLKFSDITRNLFLGYILVALFQAGVAFILFSIFRVEQALLFSVLLLFASFIPMLGAGLVWFPLGVTRIIAGDVVGGILFLVTCGILISTLDNFLRPLFLRDRINLHPLIIFFSILGGVALLGFNGLILGPVIVIFFLTVLDLFIVEHGLFPER